MFYKALIGGHGLSLLNHSTYCSMIPSSFKSSNRVNHHRLTIVKKKPPAIIKHPHSLRSFRKKEPYRIIALVIRMFIITQDLMNLLDIKRPAAARLMQQIRAFHGIRKCDLIFMEDFINYSRIQRKVAWMYLVYHPRKLDAYKRAKPDIGWMAYLKQVVKDMDKKKPNRKK